MALRSIALFMLLGVRRVALTIAGLSPRAANCINPSEADYQDLHEDSLRLQRLRRHPLTSPEFLYANV